MLAKEYLQADLPFLFKVLSVAKALSIQAHPDMLLAQRLHRERPQVFVFVFFCCCQDRVVTNRRRPEREREREGERGEREKERERVREREGEREVLSVCLHGGKSLPQLIMNSSVFSIPMSPSFLAVSTNHTSTGVCRPLPQTGDGVCGHRLSGDVWVSSPGANLPLPAIGQG